MALWHTQARNSGPHPWSCSHVSHLIINKTCLWHLQYSPKVTTFHPFHWGTLVQISLISHSVHCNSVQMCSGHVLLLHLPVCIWYSRAIVVFTKHIPYWLLTLITFFRNQNKIQTPLYGPMVYIIWLLPTFVTSSPTNFLFACIFLLAIYSSFCLEYFSSDCSERITPTHFLKPQLCETFPDTLLC